MRKNKLLSKITVGLMAVLGVFMVSSCEKTDHSAFVPIDESSVKIFEDEGTHERTALVKIGIDNNTIYNVSAISMDYTIYDNSDTVLGTESVELELFVRHGIAGFVQYTVKITEPQYLTATKVVFNHIKVTKYQSLWQTYLLVFIIGILISFISIILFAVQLFNRGLTKEMMRDFIKEKLISLVVISALFLLICFVPLMLSNWVTTVILLGVVGSTVVVDGLLTLVKMAITKKY